MSDFFSVDYYDNTELLFMLLTFSICGIVFGTVTDAVMQDRGFGAIGNGFLAMFGAFIGVYTREHYFGRMLTGDLMVTIISAASAATAILLILGVIKHWAID
ncbi:MAG: hypothetical protein KGQ46_05175 [Hyphomicrobiales bacterium]|nr:hypothetical protein [Hyphomicrobiales bacterium]MDE2113477.1 hypothetical protein [Hyphomicrobiales bacterium]